GSRAPADWVDPFVGTVADGNTHPGALVPWGMASAVPHTDPGAPPGYHRSGKEILGFGQVQISGAGCFDLGNVLLAATTAEPPQVGPDGRPPGDPVPAHRSRFSHEEATPGYYAVDLDTWKVHAEATATARATMYRLRFPAGKPATLVLDAGHALTPVVASWVGVRKADPGAGGPVEVEAISRSGNFCGSGQKQTVYVVARLSRAASSQGAWALPEEKPGIAAPGSITPPKDGLQAGTRYSSVSNGVRAGAWLRLDPAEGALLVKIGVSYVSLDNARANLEAEIPDWDFDRVRAKAREAWNRELGTMQVEGGTDDQRTLFYTGLYHVLIHPNVFSDANGQYQGMNDTGVRTAQGYTRYTIFSLWDTYRGVHPLLTLAWPRRQLDMVKSLVGMGRESDWLPIWELAGQETNVMVGDPSVPVIADSWIKGLRGFDAEEALRLATKQATQEPPPTARSKGRTGLDLLLRYGYIPWPTRTIGTGKGVWGPVSTLLEYNFADWTAARLASGLGRSEDAALFLERSQAWQQLFDPDTLQIRPKLADGSWLAPFDPAQNCPKPPCGEWGLGGPGYVEGSAWQYTFMVNHDVPRLIELMGGPARFTERLQMAFDKGYYTLDNEPDMAYPYLFTFVPGEAWRTQKQVRHDLATAFDRQALRLPGNDDAGQTSSVYVWGALGLYPVTPGSTEYRLGTPLFDRVTVTLDTRFYEGRTLVIEAGNNSPENLYVQWVLWNGHRLDRATIDHRQLTAGGTLVFEMGPTPGHWDAAPATP
ncbi:MAG TPA: GH92 family glycosyl hydrolase, partial [Vicinamibacteria bacterium]|nr:GH92 family glycosyl hydrolase [Vicinamibacteria bacterium]